MMKKNQQEQDSKQPDDPKSQMRRYDWIDTKTLLDQTVGELKSALLIDGTLLALDCERFKLSRDGTLDVLILAVRKMNRFKQYM